MPEQRKGVAYDRNQTEEGLVGRDLGVAVTVVGVAGPAGQSGGRVAPEQDLDAARPSAKRVDPRRVAASRLNRSVVESSRFRIRRPQHIALVARKPRQPAASIQRQRCTVTIRSTCRARSGFSDASAAMHAHRSARDRRTADTVRRPRESRAAVTRSAAPDPGRRGCRIGRRPAIDADARREREPCAGR